MAIARQIFEGDHIAPGMTRMFARWGPWMMINSCGVDCNRSHAVLPRCIGAGDTVMVYCCGDFLHIRWRWMAVVGIVYEKKKTNRGLRRSAASRFTVSFIVRQDKEDGTRPPSDMVFCSGSRSARSSMAVSAGDETWATLILACWQS